MTDNERIRRELGFYLAEAGRSAGVDKPAERTPQVKTDSCDIGEPEFLYFTSFDDVLAWCDSERTRQEQS